MKPICARCNLFMRNVHSGEYFIERMPGPNGAKRRELEEETPDHARMIRGLDQTPVIPGELEGWEPYKLWVGDLHECRGCGAQVIVGVPPKPIAEHFEADFNNLVARTGATRTIDDC